MSSTTEQVESMDLFNTQSDTRNAVLNSHGIEVNHHDTYDDYKYKGKLTGFRWCYKKDVMTIRTDWDEGWVNDLDLLLTPYPNTKKKKIFIPVDWGFIDVIKNSIGRRKKYQN